MNNAANSENDHVTTPHTTPSGPSEFKTSAPPSRLPLLPLRPRQTSQRPFSPLPLPFPSLSSLLSPLPPPLALPPLVLVPFPLLHIIRLTQDPCFVPFSIFHAPCSHAPCSLALCSLAFWIRCFSLKTCTFLTSIQPCSLKLGLIQSSLG